jgi:hypothetical protein
MTPARIADIGRPDTPASGNQQMTTTTSDAASPARAALKPLRAHTHQIDF